MSTGSKRKRRKIRSRRRGAEERGGAVDGT